MNHRNFTALYVYYISIVTEVTDVMSRSSLLSERFSGEMKNLSLGILSIRLALEVGDRTQSVVFESDFMDFTDFYGVYGLQVSLVRLIER